MEMVQKNRGSIPKLWPMFEPETVRKMMTNLKILWFLLAWDPKIIQFLDKINEKIQWEKG